MQEINILLYEGNPDHTELIVRSFVKAPDKYQVTLSKNLSDLFGLLKKDHNFQILLYSLVRDDETALQILNDTVIKNTIPVVFLSGPVDEFRGVELIKNGAIDYIPKTHRNLYNLPFFVSRALREWENIQYRRNAERRLVDSESKFRMVTENISDVIWEMDVEMTRFTFISSSVKRFLDYTEEEFIALKPQDVISEETLCEFRRVRKDVALGLKRGEKPDEIRFSREICFIHRSGELRWGEVRGFLVIENRDKIVAVSGIVRNITTQKQIQQQLAIREAYFEALIREAPLAIIVLDNNDRVKQVNNHFLELFQYREDECFNRHINDLIVPENLIEEAKNLTRMAAQGEYIAIETVRKTKYGQLIEVSVLGKPVMLKDSKLGVLGMYQDISQRKKMEVANHVAKIKQQFLANMSHEIRSPMTGIIGMIDLMEKTTLSGQQAFYLDVIKKSSDGLLNIVNDILDLSKIEAGKMIIRKTPFQLKKSAVNLYSLFQALAEQKKIRFLLDYDEGLPQFISGDENRISQIVTNLLSNAVKFTSEGEIRLIYRWIDFPDMPYNLQISVSDTGIGFSEADKEYLFQSFTQLDNSDTRNFEGTGLGLSISIRLAELMGGKLSAISTVGEGSTFSLLLNVEMVDDSGADQFSAAHDGEVEIPARLGYKILLAEDKRANQIVISLMFRKMGCRVDVAKNGEEALQMFSPGKYDFIFMDIQMPVMDGLTAVNNLRQKYQPEELPHIIGLSAKSMEGDADYHISKGLDDYITKPASLDDLKNCLVKWKPPLS